MLKIAHKQSNIIKGALTQSYQSLDTRRAFTQFIDTIDLYFFKEMNSDQIQTS